MPDQETLKAWVDAQDTFPECLRSEDLEYCRRQRLDFLASGASPIILEQNDAFVVWDTTAVERDTQNSVALLWASQGSQDETCQLIERSKQELSDRPLVVSISVDAEGQAKALKERGFYQLRHFVTKEMTRQELTHSFKVRVGTENDRSFLTALAVSVASHTLPPQCKLKQGQYNRILLQSLLKLDYGPDTENLLLIAEDEDENRLGYLLLRLDQRKTAWVVDIGVTKSHWGQGIAQHLVLSAENQLIERGFEFYVGEISAANERSFYVATKLCGFKPNRQLWRYDPQDS